MNFFTEDDLLKEKEEFNLKIKFLKELDRERRDAQCQLLDEMERINSGEYDDYDYAYEYQVNCDNLESSYNESYALLKIDYARLLYEEAYLYLKKAENIYYLSKYYKRILEIEDALKKYLNESENAKLKAELELEERNFNELYQKGLFLLFEEYLNSRK